MFRPLALALLFAAPAVAQEAAAPATPAKPPKLIVAIAVDQFSADIFAEYRQHFTGGLARLSNGVVFPAGYQSHAATETCPGHATILTGARPARSGIVANDWIDLDTPRADKTIYCAEDERVPGSSSSNYTVSPVHLKVQTLGDRMKAANPASRVVAVAGKDRAAVMMSGHNADQVWWWSTKAFVTYTGRTETPVVTRANTAIAAQVAKDQPALTLPPVCTARDVAIPIGNSGATVGTGRFARKAGDTSAFRASPELDGATLALAAGLFQEMKLGQGDAPDLLAVSASASDYVGHRYGTEGTEMCLQLLSLDRDLGAFFDVLDASGVDYQLVLTADHGGHDLPERVRMQGLTEAARVDPALMTRNVSDRIAAKLGLQDKGVLLHGFGDVHIDRSLAPAQKAAVQREAVAIYRAHPQVADAFTREQIAATPSPSGPPDEWTMLQRARASYDAERSGDILIALKPRIMPIPDPTRGYVATHGSFWDYDRRVPILFWRKGAPAFEQPLPVEVVDILPTLAALLALPVPAGEIDGRCLDLDNGPATTCR
ncbi:MAG: alkaline phosphatase [Alphaproteobacteria bacterium HGW-Alphaproteobacteria-16]|nr:MAG: alkaline phosphatase [Alphaproteobacteria bacterium HGW-Alphaproteobacteria-16]